MPYSSVRGAPRAANLDIPGRKEQRRHPIGIDWLSSVSFGHVGSIGRPRDRAWRRQYGNGTAAALPTPRRRRRQSHRAQRFDEMKASPWEKKTRRTRYPILNYLVPKAFEHRHGRLMA